MRAISPILAIGLLTAAVQFGCRSSPPPRVAVPAETRGNPNVTYERDPVKPMPRESTRSDADLAPPYDDQPLITQRPPEQRDYVDAYTRVGRPRMTVFVNRTMEGKLIQLTSAPPTTQGDEALPVGEYDEADAKAIDYGAIEAILTDWLAADGQVTLISPALARQRLTDEQVRDLQSGRPQMLSELAEQLGADILVQVQIRPTRQTRQGLAVRVVSEAVNTRGGQSIGRAVVDIEPPLVKQQINKYTRFLARKLMNDMTGTWSSLPTEPAAPAPTGPPSLTPPPVPPPADPTERAPEPPAAPTSPPIPLEETSPPTLPPAPSSPPPLPLTPEK